MRDGWAYSSLGDLCEYRRGLTYKKSDEVTASANAVLRANNIDLATGTLNLDEIRYIRDDIEIAPTKRLCAGSLLVCTASGSKSHLGKIAYIESDLDFAFGGFMGLLVPCPTINPRYLYWITRSNIYGAFIDALSDGVNINNLKWSQLSELVIPLPPLPEQERIVAVLDEAFEAIATATANTEKNLANARELFEACRDAKLQAHSRGWSESPLSELVTFKHGFAFKSEYFVDDGEYVCLTPGNFFERGGYRDRGDKQKRYRGPIPDGFLLKSGDMLVAMTEQAAGLLGSPLIVPASGIFLHNQRLGLAEPRQDVPWCNEYFAHVFNTREFRDEVHRHASGVKVRHTSPTKLSAIRVRYPDSTEGQAAIANALDALEESVRRLRVGYVNRVDHLANLKQSILEKAFCGELTAVDRELSDAGV